MKTLLFLATLLLSVHDAFGGVLYVSTECLNPTPPFATWETAAANIQAAVDAAAPGDEIVVTNGIYAAGGRAVGTNLLANRVAVDKAVTIRSVNGAQVTIIEGAKVAGGWAGCGEGAMRCVYLASGATLSGFTLTNGATRMLGSADLEQSGGGLWCESAWARVTDCVVARNSAFANGGGVYSGVLTNCTLQTNSAYLEGGGAYQSELNGCTLVGNAARTASIQPYAAAGGGAYDSTLTFCTLSGNFSTAWGGGVSSSRLYHCTLSDNLAWYYGGGADSSTLQDCTLTRNSALRGGGGVFWSTVTNCILSGNSAVAGGGAYSGTLVDCILNGNRATGTNTYPQEGGGGAYGSSLWNCTIASNSASAYGGGVLHATGLDYDGAPSTVSGCLMMGNVAYQGGAAASCVLNNCAVIGNRATNSGGGVYSGSLHNCTVAANSAAVNGGASGCSAINSILYFNEAATNPNYGRSEFGSTLSYCCTTPKPASGAGNITNAPQFVDFAGGDLRLQSNSPCINAGLNSGAPGPMDLDCNPRIVSGTIDMGAYEYQGQGSLISYAWLQQYEFPTDGSADFADADSDGMNNWEEWRCGTDPTNVASVLRMLSAAGAGTDITVTWQSVAGINYFLERSTNLNSPFALLETNLPGQGTATTFSDSNAAVIAPLFYRVGVRSP